LFESLRPLFANKPIIVGLNKIDLVRRDQLSPENEALLAKLEADEIQLLQMSTISTEGIMDVRNKVIHI
jgi:nucleolar GTP-binding protein